MLFYTFIPKLINMSLTASVAIVLVMLLRLLLKKIPKVISYALWGVVLFRLLCPVSIGSSLSLYNLLDAPTEKFGRLTSVVEYVPTDIVHTEYPSVVLPLPGISDAINEALPQGREQLAADPLEAPVSFATYVWMAGVVAMVIYSVVSYIRLRLKLAVVVPLQDNIFIADDIKSPFVVGLFRPKIYLPCNLGEKEQEYIILHEQHHIRRLDHIIKALAFLALTIHWFNPLVWVAFSLAGKDMEMSCDEAVIRKMGEDVRADYSASLLTLATGRRIIAGTPLAFGEGDTKGRIRNLGKWRKPAVRVIVIAVILCIALAVCLLTNPAEGMHLYEIDDSRNYSDLLLDREHVKLVSEGEEYSVTDQSAVLEALDKIKVASMPISRSRDENRDSTHQVVLDERTYINFSWNYTTVWIDNRVKPTYSYLVTNPLAVRNIFKNYFEEPVEHAMPVTKPAMSFAGLEPDNTLVDEAWIDVSSSGAYMEYVITYSDQAIILEAGLIAEDGTEIAHIIEDGSANRVFEDIPIGKYHLFVRNVGYQNDLPGVAVTGGAMACELVGGTSEDMPYDQSKVIHNLDEEKLTASIKDVESYYFWTNSTKIGVTVNIKTEFSGKVMLWTSENMTDWILITEISSDDRRCEFSGLTSGTYYALSFEGLSDCTVTVDDGSESLLDWLS